MKNNLLILSDLHFCVFAVANDFAPAGSNLPHQIANAVSMRTSLLECLSQFDIDAVLVSGDLTSIAAPAAFIGTVEFVEQVRNHCELEPKDVFYTFGNHDLNWRISKLRDATEKFGSDTNYARVAAEIGGLFVTNTECSILGPVPGSGLFHRDFLDVVLLNSAYYCTHDQSVEHGKLGQEQLRWLDQTLPEQKTDGKWRVMMVHHHPFNYEYPTPGLDISTLEEGAELVEIIGHRGVDLVCHGHRHHPRLSTQLRNGWQNPVTFFCAGSVGVTEKMRNNGQIPNLFHVVTLEERSNQNAAVGRVESFEYSARDGWDRVNRSSQVPLDSPQRFGSCATSDEQRSELQQCFEVQLKQHPENPVPLPDLDSLPLALKCMPLVELKRLMSEVATDIGCNVIGTYPDEVILLRR